MPLLESHFAPQGALASCVEGYCPREGQQLLAQAIADNLDAGGVLLAEAGTGTGKTFAYLLPILLSGQKAIVSTATKNLQEQIYTADLPLVRKMLATPAKVALLKGRRNYFCHYHYSKLQERPPAEGLERSYRRHIEKFVDKSKDGDLVGLQNVPEDADIIHRITSTTDNCLGRECEFFEQCFVQKARQKAKEADVVVVNHHLLLADFSLKSDGFAEILPDIDAFIIDEAHHLPQTAINFLGERFSQRQMQRFLDDLDDCISEDASDALVLRGELKKTRHLLSKVRLSLPTDKSVQYYDGEALAELEDFWKTLQVLAEQLGEMDMALAPHLSRSKALDNFGQRLADLRTMLAKFLIQQQATLNDEETLDEEIEKNQEGDIFAQWLDVGEKHFMLNSVPVNAGAKFANWIRQSGASWSFLSATLAVNGGFDHFRRELGLSKEVDTLQLGSPFDYRRQALLYHPQGLPNPNQEDYTEKLIIAALPVLERSGGRAFVLFTSYRAMYIAKRALQDSDFNLFVQGEGSKTQLLASFRKTKRAVLLATASFWEGVDVRGDGLVCVVIDKLPFSAPNDPVTKTRHRLLVEKGLSPFIHDSLPQAVITLKQGVGRLIRDVNDYGVLLIGDPRLTQKSYGKVFLDSLPRMTRSDDITIVHRFFDYHEKKN